MASAQRPTSNVQLAEIDNETTRRQATKQSGEKDLPNFYLLSPIF